VSLLAQPCCVRLPFHFIGHLWGLFPSPSIRPKPVSGGSLRPAALRALTGECIGARITGRRQERRLPERTITAGAAVTIPTLRVTEIVGSTKRVAKPGRRVSGPVVGFTPPSDEGHERRFHDVRDRSVHTPISDISARCRNSREVPNTDMACQLAVAAAIVRRAQREPSYRCRPAPQRQIGRHSIRTSNLAIGLVRGFVPRDRK
jgi:hypothetical protein